MSTFKKKFLKDILPFLPLLGVYVSIIFIFSSNVLNGDEVRYIKYAKNLTNGFYTYADNPSFRNGPGYPLLITLGLLLKMPYIVIKLLNAFLLAGAVIYFYNALRYYLSPKKAIALSYVFGLYPPTLKFISDFLTEPFSLFLVCGFLYYFLSLQKESSKKALHITLSAIFLGILALTKSIFGYVIIALLAFYLIIYLFKKSNKIKHSLLVLIGSFLICTPYLAYTYSMTGKTFLWGTQGGEMLYWRASPFAEEQGNWISYDIALGNRQAEFFSTVELSKNHGAFIQSAIALPAVQRDSLFKKKAIENIKQHPMSYIKHTGTSAFRLFFNYPFSYQPQKTSSFFYILPNMFLLVFLFLAICLSLLNRHLVPFEIRFLSLTALIFMGGLILLDGRVRFLLPVIPVLLFFIAFTFDQFVRLKVKGVSAYDGTNGNPKNI